MTVRNAAATSSAVSQFFDVESLVGNTGDDRFEFLNSGSLSGSIDGNVGNDTLIGDSDGNIFTVTTEDAGTLAGKVTGGFIEIENLAGGLASDTFNVNADLNGGITGFAGEDVVVVADGVTVAGAIDTGSAADQLTFGDNTVIGGLVTGGAASDTLTILGAITATIGGGAGNDVFILTAASSVTGTLDGGADVDEIRASNTATTFVISTPDAGSVIGQADAFTSIEKLTGGTGDDLFQFETAGRLTAGIVDGGAGTDTLEGDLNSNNFVISGTDSGTYDSDQAVGGAVAFTNVESLDGRSGNDSFRFTTLGFLSDTLHGGAGLDELVASSNGDFFHVTATNAGTLYDDSSMTVARTVNGFLSIENLTGGDGEDTFDIDADIFGNLLGGDENDTFLVDANVGGNLDGGTGVNTLSLGVGASIDGTVSNVVVNQTVTAPQDGSPDQIELRLNATSGALEAVVNGVVNPFFVPRNLDLTITIPATTDDTFLTINNANGGLIDADIVFNGGTGDDDLSVIGSGSPAENAVYTPNVALNAAGVVEIENFATGITQSITFQDAGPLDFANVARLTFVTPLSNDVVDLSAGLDAHFGTQNALVVSGTTGGVAFPAAHIRSTISVDVDLATNDGVLPNDVVNITDGALQANSDLAELSVRTGNGTDTFNVSEDDYLLPGAAAVAVPTSILPQLTISDVITNEGDPTTFGTATNINVGGFTPEDMVEFDFDGDGDIDLATIDSFNGFVTVLANLGNGVFTVAATTPINTFSPDGIAAGDFNNDGRDDLAIFDDIFDTVEVLQNFSFVQDNPVFFTTSFQTIAYTNSGFFPNFSGIEAEDIDNDGDIDLVLSNDDFGFGFGLGHITVVRNSFISGSTFTGLGFVTNGQPLASQSSGAEDLVLDDFDGDGSPDVVVLSDGFRDGFSFMPNSGTGTFSTGTFTNSVTGLRAVTSGDVNGDGRPDVIVLDATTIRVFENQGGTTPFFLAGAVITTGEFNGADVVAADFNGDGNLDVAMADGSDSTDVIVSFGDGTGNFGGALRFPTGLTFAFGGASLVAADFTGDGRIDLAQYHDDFTTNIVSILPNTTASTALVTVSLSAIATQPVTVEYTLSNGLATSPGDFDGSPGTLTIPTGQSSATIAIQIQGDLNIESDENFFVNLANPVNAVIADLQAQVTIRDDDGFANAGPRINIATPPAFTEGDSGVAQVSIPVTLSAALGFDVSVDFETRAVTAQAGVDYIDATGTVTFTAGSTTASILIDIPGDLVNEGAETFLVRLLNSTSVVLGNTQTVVTIAASDTNVPVFNNGLTLDGGIGTDRVIVTANVGLIELDATTGAERIRLGSVGVPGSLGTANLVDLAGEDVTVQGGAGDNTFDLSLWSNGARAVVNGLGGDDTFVGLDVVSNWTITSTNGGQVGAFTFNNIENLVGGAADDTFIFDGGFVTGSVDGGSGGVNSLTVGNTENAWTLERAAGGTVRLGSLVTDPQLLFDNLQEINGGTGVDTFEFAGGTVARLNGGTGEDAITGDNLANTWNVRDVNGDLMTVDEGTLASALGITIFSGIENLIGGDLVDTFVYDRNARISRTIDGGAGSANVLDLSGYVTTLTATLSSIGSITGFAGAATGSFLPVGDAFDNITAINFNTLNSTIGDRLVGLNSTSQWDFGTSTYTTAGRSLNFVLGSTDDVTGGSSTDTFSFVGVTTPAIRNVSGAGGADTITGNNVATSWTINGLNAGQLQPGISVIGGFSNIENVVGGSNVDTFTFTNAGRLDGAIDGGAGADVIVGDTDGVQITVTAGLSDSGTIFEQDGSTAKVVGGFTSVENLTGAGFTDVFVINGALGGAVNAGGGNDSITFGTGGTVAGVVDGGFGFDLLVGDDNANVFVITGANAGTVTGKMSSFRNIETLSGAGGDDSFTFADAGNINGQVIGGAGNDTIIGDEDGNIFSVSGADSGVLFGKNSAFREVENLFGGAAADSFSVTGSLSGNIDGRADADIFSFLAATTIGGTVTGGSGADTFTLSGTVVGRVLGGTGNDTFNLNAGANIFAGGAGTAAGPNGVDGGAGNDRFNVNGALTATLDGGADLDTILGPNGATITITGPGQGTIVPGPSGGFFNMDSIQGSTGSETIIIAGNFGGDFDAGGGDDNITIQNGGSVNNLNAGDGNDTVVIEDGGAVTGDIDLGAGNDSLSIADLATFDGIINGGTGDDIVTIDFSAGTPGQPRTITFNGDAGDDDLVLTGGGATSTVDYTVGPNADEGTIVTDLDGNAGTANDRQTITFTGLEPVEDTQTAATFTINGSASNNTINVTDGNDGVGGLNEVNFNGAFELVRFSNKTTVEVNGLGGADTVNLNYTAGSASFAALNVNAGAGNDTVNVLAGHRGSIDGGDDSDQIILSNGVTVSGTVGGGSGTDTLNYAAYMANVAVNLQTRSATSINNGNAAGISGFESLTGGLGSDTLTGDDDGTANAVNITGANTGNIDTTFSFSSVENLVGGSDDDSFNFSNAASVAGTIDGGSGGTDTLNYGAYITAVSVNLDTSAATAINGGMMNGFSNIDSIAGGSAADSITGPDADQTWTISGSEAGTVNSVSFSEFESLNGGSGDDSFAFVDGVTLDFAINGGAENAADTVTFAASSVGVSVDVSLLSNIETLTGSANTDTLVGTSGDDVFDVTAANAGTINTNTAFTSFENLTGAGGDDSFLFGAAGSLISGNVDGQSGTDTLSYDEFGSAVNVELTASGSDGFGGTGTALGGFSNIDALTGNSGSTDSVTALDVASTWTVAGTPTLTTGTYSVGASAPTLILSSFESLVGAATAADDFSVTGTPTATLDGRGGDDEFEFATGAVLDGSVTGGLGNDTLNFANSATVITVSLTGLGTGGVGFDGITNSVMTGSFTSIDTVIGGSGDDTLAGLANAAGTWAVDTTSVYVSTNTLDFSGIDNLTGSDQADTFNVNVSATVDIVAGDGADQFTVAGGAVISGTLDGGAGIDDFDFNGVITLPTIDGGADSDTLDLSDGTNAVNVSLDNVTNVEFLIGTAQGDTLTGTSGADAFEIVGSNDNGTVNSTVTFSSFENLAGAGGADSFKFPSGLGLTGSIDGGADVDVIDYSQYSTGVSVNLATGVSTNIAGGISNIENAIGGQNDDSLTGSAVDNSLVGGLGSDVFFVTDGGDDTITGGMGTDTVNFSLATGPITIDLDDAAAQTVRTGQTVELGAGGIENFVGSTGADQVTVSATVNHSVTGNGGSDTLVSNDNANNVWAISSDDTGTLEDTPASGTVVTFAGFANLTGNAGNDLFDLADDASITGTINGGLGTDTVDFADWDSGVSIDSGNLVSIETLVGGMADDTLVGGSGGTDFVVTGSNAGTAQNVGSSDVLNFTDVENLAGAAGDDSFTFNAGGSLGSAVDGGAGANTLTFNNATGDDDVMLTGVSSDVGYSGTSAVTNFANITTLNGGGGQDTLTGLGVDATWSIAANGTYTTGTTPNERVLNFSGFETVRGGSGADSFTIAEDLKMVVDGRGGVDSILVTNDTVEITGPIVADGFSGTINRNVGNNRVDFDGINSVVGTSGTNTLQRMTGGKAATWVLNTTTGNSFTEEETSTTMEQILTFSGMLNLIGGNANDTFNITGSNAVNITADGGNDVFNFLDNAAEITGTIDAGTGTDTLDFSGVTNGVTVDLASLTDFESIIGGSSPGNDTLIGDANNNVFNVTSAGAGTVELSSDPLDDVSFSGFETLQGAAGDDTFTFADGATVSRIDGGTGDDTIDLTLYATARTVALTGSATDGFNGTEAAVGTFAGITTVNLKDGVSGNTLSGLNNDSAWKLDATPTYTTSSRVLNFSGVGAIAGGSATDIFNVGDGGAMLDINGGAGNDELVIADQQTLTGSFDGGEGFDTIDLSAYTTSTTFTVLDHGTDNGLMLNATGLETSLGQPNIADNIDTVIGGSATDEVIGLNQQSAWSLSTIDDTVDQYFTQFTDPGTGDEFGRTLFASGIETRTGGSDIDTFTLQMDRLVPGVTHTVNGKAGNDVFFLEFNAGTSFNADSSLVINGGDPSADIDNVDTVSIFVDKAGEIARNIGVTYDSIISGDVSVTGLGGASALDINGVETLDIIGDAGNDDTVSVTTTTAADSVTVVPAANGGQVFLGGTTALPGVAGGSTGPDITVSGVTNTAGISINGSTGDDTLLYVGSPTVTPSAPGAGTLSSAGLADVVYTGFETVDATGTLSFAIGATTDANDNVADTFNVAINGGSGLLEVTVNGNIVLQQDVSTIDQLVIDGSNDDDTLTVNYSNGNPVPVGGLIFNGGRQMAGDSLIVIGDGIGKGSSGTYTPSATTNGDGVVSLDGTTITFTGLEPVTISEITNFAFVTPNAVDIIVIDSPAGGVNRVTGTSGGVTFESLTFSNVANFTLDAATNDVDSTSGDSITFAADLVADGLLSLTANGGLGNDTIDASTVTTLGVSLNGGSGNDTLVTGGGNDSIDGGAGTDTVRQTADGTQTLTADTLLTGNGMDTLAGIERADLIGGAGNDTISVAGFSGQATLSGLGGDDTLTGGLGNDSLDGGSGSDTVLETGAAGYVLTTSQLTGFGTDSLTGIENANLTGDATANTINASGFAGTATTLSGGAGNDTITGSPGRDSIEGGADDDTLQGAAGDDTISGGTGNDLLLGGSGSDMLTGDAGDDTVDGGSGSDTMNGEGGTDVVQASGSLNYTATDSQIAADSDIDTYFEFELLSIIGDSAANRIDASAATISTMLDGGFGNDTIIGGSGKDSIFGNQGNDLINGGAGDDTIDGGADNDTLVGGAGTDTLSVTANTTLTIGATQTTGNGTDTFSEFEQAILTGGVGNNRLDASAATINVTLQGLEGNDTLLGGAGDDLLDGGDGIDASEITGSNIVLTDGSIPGSGSDVTISLESLQLVADGAGSIIDASAYTLGPVTIIGSGGADTLRGGSGDDLILAGAGADLVEGGGGADNLMGNAGDDTISGGDGIDSINGGSGQDLLLGDAGTDVLRGGGGSDTLRGGTDDDTLFGDAGADTIFGEDGNDQLYGGSGNDGLNGGSGNDIVNGNSGDDTLLGFTGMDTLLGGSGRDILIGGDDDDTVRGQGGADTMAGNGGSDKIESTSADRIDEAFNESLFPELLGL